MPATAEAPPLLGNQTPTHRVAPSYEYTLAPAVIDVAEMAGLKLDPYQADVLTDGLGVSRRPSQFVEDNGLLVPRWAAREVGIELSRQNGKSVIFEARCLGGLYVFRERLIVYSAHKGETAMGAFERIESLIRSNRELLAEVRRFNRTNGKEGIELYSGQKLKFRTRTTGGGRGLSGDCVILDEAQDLEDGHLAALLPVLSARPDPQLWYGGSAGNHKSVVQGRLVRRCERGAPFLVYYRWAADPEADRDDPKTWARVNPALGRRMTVDFMRTESDAMGYDQFGQERLGIGDYPRAEGEDWPIPRHSVEAAKDPKSAAAGRVVFCPEVQWGTRARGTIGVAGLRADGGKHLEVIDNQPGTRWMIGRLISLCANHANLGVVIDPQSPANTLVGPLRDAGIEPYLLTAQDLTQAFGDLHDGMVTTPESPLPTYHHRGGTVLLSAFAEAKVKTSRGSTTWQRAVSADVGPVLSTTWAAHGVTLLDEPPKPPVSPRSTSELEAAAQPGRRSPYAGPGADVDFSTVQF